MRTNRSIRAEAYRTEIRTTIRMEYSLIPYPVWSRIMDNVIVSSPVIAHMMNMRTIMCTTVSPIMIRYTKIE